jgi:hypothetical protein
MTRFSCAALLLALLLASCGPAAVRDVPVPGGAPRLAGDATACMPSLQPPILPFDPATVLSRVDNPYFPLRPGTTLVYETRTAIGQPTGTDTVTVLRQPRVVLGVSAWVRVERSFRGGRLVAERTGAFVQDRKGNVWQLAGEERALGADSALVRVSAWEAGKDSAWAGVVMPGEPDNGMEFRTGWRRGVAEGYVRVEAVTSSAHAMEQAFSPCVVVTETPSRMGASHCEKTYAPGVGLVTQVTPPSGEPSRTLKKIIVEP